VKNQKYAVNQYQIDTILTWVKTGEIAIPEIQRPFVWSATQVRDFMDSLYQGFPVGYIIAWRNPNVKLKDGRTSDGKKILIDGQQRVTSLTAAILGQPVITQDYRKARIRISFNPIDETFEVFNSAIAKNAAWINDIAELFNPDFNFLSYLKEYGSANPGLSEDLVFERLNAIKNIPLKQIGLIELDADLDIETVTEIFIRINSKGVPLSQADFAMSKIAVAEEYGGPNLRKCIDYFCHLAVAPEFYSQIEEADRQFVSTKYFQKMSWLKNENDDLYDPDYTDVLRVAFISEFERGKLADLVSLLSGRNFEKKTYEEEIVERSFLALERGVLGFINETNFKNFLMIIRSAGFITPGLIRSQAALNFAYVLYLKLKSRGYQQAEIERYVRKWFVLSVLTGRYSGSPETAFDNDIKNICATSFGDYLRRIEEAELSDIFWNVTLVENMETSAANSPYLNVFFAAQVKMHDKGFLSRDITVNELISLKGDIHHIFPRDYLKKNGLTRKEYNQISNYVYMQSETNIRIGNKPPRVYFGEILEQCNGGPLKYGGISTMEELRHNLAMNCIPESVFTMEIDDYNQFLTERKKLMASKIREYYRML
jgi:hypothetical protein